MSPSTSHNHYPDRHMSRLRCNGENGVVAPNNGEVGERRLDGGCRSIKGEKVGVVLSTSILAPRKRAADFSIFSS